MWGFVAIPIYVYVYMCVQARARSKPLIEKLLAVHSCDQMHTDVPPPLAARFERFRRYVNLKNRSPPPSLSFIALVDTGSVDNEAKDGGALLQRHGGV